MSEEFAPVLRARKDKKDRGPVAPVAEPKRHRVHREQDINSTTWSKLFRGSFLVLVVPVLFSVPYILSVLGEFFRGREMWLVYVWAFYAALLAFVFFYWRRKTITMDSFLTQMMTWAIFALGAYTLVDIPKMVELHLRQVVLYIWLTFSMVFNFLVFFLDNTDYQAQQRKEQAKEERRKKKEEERQKKQQEKKKSKKQKRRQQLEAIFGRRGMILIDALVYAALLGAAYFILYFCYQWYERFSEEVASRSRGSGYRHVEPEWQPEDF